jgi:hypothetical protein
MPIRAERIATGLDAPLFGASAPGDPDRLFVLEKNTGRVVILDLDTNQLSAQAFFDVPDSELTSNGERGLLGLAFHPDYQTNGLLYLFLTNEDGDGEVWELTRSADPDLADAASQRLILTIDRDPTRSNHNGGWMDFGPDGLLYIAVGDNGVLAEAQDITDLRGKLLRIDVNGDDFADAARNYAIPDDNPFVGRAGADEVFAYGLRNPWRASFDAATGDLYIADVGASTREEINYLVAGTGAGINFGWPFAEGSVEGPPTDGLPVRVAPLQGPLLEYAHGLGDFQGESVTGGYVYRGPGGGQGMYVFADFISGHVWTLRVQDGQAFDWRQRDGEMVVNGGALDRIASFAVDGRGQLYAIGLDGEIFRFTITDDPAPPAGDGDSFFDRLGDAVTGLGEAPVQLAESLFDLF